MGKINLTKMKILSVDEKNIIISTNFKRCIIRYYLNGDSMYINTSDITDIYDVARFVHKLFYPNKNFENNLPFLQNLDSVGFCFNECGITITKQEANVKQILRIYEMAYKKKWRI